MGKLTAKYSKRYKDILVNYEAPEDGALVFSTFYTQTYHPASDVWSDSFIKELEKRGYDITTLKFSIEKKK